MRKVQVTGCNLVQHGSEEEKILSIDQRDLKARIACQGLLQPERRVQATESSAEYQNSLGVLHGHLTATLFSAKARRFFWNMLTYALHHILSTYVLIKHNDNPNYMKNNQF